MIKDHGLEGRAQVGIQSCSVSCIGYTYIYVYMYAPAHVTFGCESTVTAAAPRGKPAFSEPEPL